MEHKIEHQCEATVRPKEGEAQGARCRCKAYKQEYGKWVCGIHKEQSIKKRRALSEKTRAALRDTLAAARPPQPNMDFRPLPGGVYKKPPLGIIPRSVWKIMRAKDLVNAVDRYNHAGQRIPQCWIDELKVLIGGHNDES